MIRMRGLLGPMAAATMVALAATPASAGDGYGEGKQNPAPAWRGFYVGAAAAYGIGTSELSVDGDPATDFAVSGAQAVLTAGYDVQLSPRWVAGLFADYAFGEVDFRNSFGADLLLTLDKQWAIGGRLGVLATPTTLLYVSAGYTAADFKATLGPAVLVDATLDGYFVGLGVEQVLGRNLSLKLDYRYSDYEDAKAIVDTALFTFENTVHSVRLGVNWRFAGAHSTGDHSYDQALAPPAPTWSGLYVGAAAGYAIGSSELTVVNDTAGPFSVRGAQGVVTAGYDFRLSPKWVAGLFADYAFGELDGRSAESLFTIDNQWAVGARLGVLATPSTLLYASAGYTAADFRLSEEGSLLVDLALDGYFVGLGVEQALGRSLSLKLDYRFSDYGDVEQSFNSNSFENSAHAVRLGVNWKLH